MKYAFLSVLISQVFFSLKYCTPSKNISPPNANITNYSKWIFDKDSGYVLNKTMAPILWQTGITDATISRLEYANLIFENPNDTVAKYYIFNDSSALVCVVGNNSGFPVHIVMHVSKTKNNEIKVEQYELFHHANFDCCWNRFDGFTKQGSLYGLKICGTAAGFCSSSTMYFNELKPQDSLQAIIQQINYGDNTYKTAVTSVTQVLDVDKIVVTYTFSEDISDEITNKEARTKKIFSIKYNKQKNRWVASDSGLVKKYLLY